MASLWIPIRTSAVALVAGGVATSSLVPWHPSIFDRPVADAVHQAPAWELIHVAGVLAPPLAFLGAAGIVAAHSARMGRLGAIGLLLTLLGTIGAGSFAVEAIAFPALADDAPELLALDGPILMSWPMITIGILVLGWPIGLAVIGIAALRARVFPRSASVLLALSGPLFLILAGPFVPVAGGIAGLLFGAVQVWWGVLLWRRRR